MLIHKTITIIITSFIIICHNLYAEIIVQGLVRDNGGDPVENALVEFSDQADTNIVFSSTTNTLGEYSVQIIETGIGTIPAQHPDAFIIMQNYPNPFNPSTVINYEIPKPAYIRIEVYNVLGQKIKTLFDGMQTGLYGRVVWDATNEQNQSVAAGVYFYSLFTDGIRINRKMLLLDGHLGDIGHSGPVNNPEPGLLKTAATPYRLRVSGTDIETFIRQDLQISENSNLDVTVIRTITDIDGNVYRTVKIGEQWWLAEDLKATRYRNGDPIANVTDNTEWSNLATGAYCYYDNNPEYAGLYGALYNWYATNDSRSIALEGWHVPTDAEWQILIDYLGGNDIAGAKIKTAGTEYWCLPNEGTTNESGFTAMPGGNINHNGLFSGIGVYALYWSATSRDSNTALVRVLYCNATSVFNDYYENKSGLTIRLVKD